MSEGFIPRHGGYQNLKSYQKAEIVFDGTVRFCNRFIGRTTRTHDQMVQAARSGKQNIAEASQVSGTSRETEIKLTNIARRDFLRLRGSAEWPPEHRFARRLRELNRIPDADYATFQRGIENQDPVIAANVLIGLIRVTCYLLDRQLNELERTFLAEGGLRERMTKARRDIWRRRH